MADDITLFRLTASGDTQANINANEKIEMLYGISETEAIGVIDFSVGVPQRRTDVPNVGGVRKTTRPATGLVSVPITMQVVINETSSDQAKLQARFLRFSLDQQDIRSLYPEGRFGLENKKLSGFPKITPDSMSGIRFVNYSIDDQIAWSNHQLLTVELEFVGDYTDYLAALLLLDPVVV